MSGDGPRCVFRLPEVGFEDVPELLVVADVIERLAAEVLAELFESFPADARAVLVLRDGEKGEAASGPERQGQLVVGLDVKARPRFGVVVGLDVSQNLRCEAVPPVGVVVGVVEPAVGTEVQADEVLLGLPVPLTPTLGALGDDAVLRGAGVHPTSARVEHEDFSTTALNAEKFLVVAVHADDVHPFVSGLPTPLDDVLVLLPHASSLHQNMPPSGFDTDPIFGVTFPASEYTPLTWSRQVLLLGILPVRSHSITQSRVA